ncbi:molybdenum cofactor biosynthesis protein MoaE [Flagellimonas zhangzhouensis]|uniref:Molybdopterin synthase catalytic subunit n=1 Tax=Flagellimonas zhangzhouensis TaxID=1073328 RepID=A0A1H2S687_9FLAO|nr:molybdenum cofactor biosynthesis protein MoaE [Allomuricauda zhangzhouensis]SDQ71035.1 molybdopterin synthase catalytic subunit [Allomuricauda zhangzhouensis]SDW26995.1 molybdopterin synthase catalytic subunit [Allomuricauda zhangzhouensis]
MDKRKPKKVFIQGAIPPEKIATSVANHQSKSNIGAHSIFLGQIRADEVDGKTVTAIDYTAYEEMAENVFHQIREATFAKFDITCAHVYHSLGKVNVGELCLFVFTSSAHRKIAIEATNFLVEEIKAKVPVFGKEIFEDETHQWKVNK